MIGIASFTPTRDISDDQKEIISSDPFIKSVQVFARPCIKTQTSKTIDNLLEDIEWIGSIGKEVRVSFNFHEAVVGRKHRQTQQDRPNLCDSVDILSLSLGSFPDFGNRYFQAILDNLDRIDRVVFSWTADYTCGAYMRWLGGVGGYRKLLMKPEELSLRPMMSEIEAMSSFSPEILRQGKFAICSVELPFEREAYLYQGRLEEARILNWLKRFDVLTSVCGGSWALHADGGSYDRSCKDGLARSPIFVYRDGYEAGEYPYQYYQDYLKQGNFESGIGFKAGIENGNAQKLMDLGYKRSWFFVNQINQNLETWAKWRVSAGDGRMFC